MVGGTWVFLENSYRDYAAAFAAAEEDVAVRFGSRPHFCSPDAVAAWELEVIAAAHKRLFTGERAVYKGAVNPDYAHESWANVEAFRLGIHSPRENGCPLCGRVVEYGSCRWTDCPGNAGVEDTNYL